MSLLIGEYEISVFDDELDSQGNLIEKRKAVIGSNKMLGQGRAIQPTLVRSINGQNKFSFKMYRYYTDNLTGEKIENPYISLLVSERKVKLHYKDKWYDFIIKNIVENNRDYLYTYSLEDANVQELSKNGFGVTLDAELMNNIGSSEELAEFVMQETDWDVQNNDVVVQTIEEALIYIRLPENTLVRHLLDQSDLSYGVTEEQDGSNNSVEINLGGKTVLAFYSSCKNKPHRFQFIYSDKGYNKIGKKYNISRKDDRTINEKDCQYYIDFDKPEEQYSVHNTTYDIYLPTGFVVSSIVGFDSNNINDKDTVVSTWYRGARYGFAQQAVYVPLLERYCQKFKTEIQDIAIDPSIITWFDNGETDVLKGENSNYTSNIFTCVKSQYGGLQIKLPFQKEEVYKIAYKVESTDGQYLRTIGGHHDSFEISKFTIRKDNASGEQIVPIDVTHLNRAYVIYDNETKQGTATTAIWFEAYYHKTNLDNDRVDSWPYIHIQPNRDVDGQYAIKISEISIERLQEYYGYIDTEYISPTLLQNCITNYNFKTDSGWTATQSTKISSNTKPSAESVYGRFITKTSTEGDVPTITTFFKSIVEDYIDGTYADTNPYKTYLKMSFKDSNQFVLNSGIRDNRTTIGNMPEGEEWVLDYRIVDEHGNLVLAEQETAGGKTEKVFEFNLKEFIYNKSSGAYNERTSSNTPIIIEEDVTNPQKTDSRIIFKVSKNNYTEEEFKGKKESKGTYLQLQIKPLKANIRTEMVDGKETIIPAVYYIEHIALYRKSLDKNSNIIVPDYEAENSKSAEDYINNSTLEHRYNYFNAWHVDSANPGRYTDKEALPLYTTDTLEYDVYKPQYNEGAKKVRAVSVKESNYFNILQSIAETFEQWLVISIDRNEDGSIKPNGKKISFKNYRGDNNNYACFRYGVNLKDIQRTYVSKNIVTKLIVKANSNELGKNGFCTIQRAGANPTGENYIYDFQYYQNKGLMDVNNYLTTNYYLSNDNGIKAKGYDAQLWKLGEVDKAENDTEVNLYGYFPRLKKINEELLPLDEEIIGLQTDLVQEKARKEVVEAQKEAALNGIEQTRLDFHALTGVYPEDAQNGKIVSISDISVTPWGTTYQVKTSATNPNEPTLKPLISSSGNKVMVTLERKIKKEEIGGLIQNDGTEMTELTSGAKRIVTIGECNGIYVTADWDRESIKKGTDGYKIYRTYELTYELEVLDGTLKNIGCHHHYFKNVTMTVQDLVDKEATPISNSNPNYEESTICNVGLKGKGAKYLVTIQATHGLKNDTENFKYQDDLWIQPNRTLNQEVTCKISKVKLIKIFTDDEMIESKDAKVDFTLEATLNIQGEGTSTYSVKRSIDYSYILPAGQNEVTATVEVTAVNMARSDVKKYITELTTYNQSYKEAKDTLDVIGPRIIAKQGAIDTKSQLRSQYLEWKKQLNKLFFQHYHRFIQEGTWINEEYVDDEKYYIDAQSVMYNSCYPQVTYAINVLELSQLPGYELFKFDLGDKTQVIDDEFFGDEYREEVIITELSEVLDDPSKNTAKVQNFKNQFQDLFQKITATVQQTQYNAGSYEKGAALLKANDQKKSEFITNAINNAQSYLSAGQTVESGPNGITITDDSNKKRRLRLVGGAILFSTEDPDTKETMWRTGLTNEGISADLITAGQLDAGTVQIMSGDDPVFRWDAYGISAYSAVWYNDGVLETISGVDSKKFVRFDKHGIYGIDESAGIDGQTWHPTGLGHNNDPNKEIDEKATFALTWEGLKVVGSDNVVARIGRSPNILDESGNVVEYGKILRITRKEDTIKELMSFSNDGTLTIGGWSVDQDGLFNGGMRESVGAMKSSTETPEVFLTSQAQERSTNSWFSDGKTDHTDYIVFKAGMDFMVSESGTLYAKSGYIGSMAIEGLAGQINSKMSADGGSNKAYSWLFSSTDGIFMWGGARSNSTTGARGAIFAIYKDGNNNKLYMNGYGEFTGTISAENGYIGRKGGIGGWKIGENTIFYQKDTNNGLGQDGSFYLYATGKEQANVFGLSNGQKQTWLMGLGSNFGVTNTGEVYCRKINIRQESKGGAFGFKVRYLNNEVTLFTDYQLVNNNVTESLSDSCYLTIKTGDAITQFTESGLMHRYVTAPAYGATFITSGITTDNKLSLVLQSTGGDILFKIAGGKTVNVSDLVFEGAYDIRYGSTSGAVVGKLNKMGPLVYGYLRNDQNVSVSSEGKLYVTKQGSTTAVNIPMRASAIQISWYNKGATESSRITLSRDANNNLTMTIGNIDSVGILESNYSTHAYSYFAYGLNSAYDL